MSSPFQRPSHAAGAAHNEPGLRTASGGRPFEPPASDPIAGIPEWPWRSSGESVMAGPTVPTHDLFRPEPAEAAADPGNSPATSSSAPAKVTPVAPRPLAPSVNPEGLSPMPAPEPAPIAAANQGQTLGQVFVPMPPESEAATYQQPDMTPVPPPRADGGKLGTWAVFFLIFAVTTAAGLVDAYINGSIGWVTGAAFVVAATLGALLVRRRDLATAVISPPLAFLFALIVGSQPTLLGNGGNALVKQASSLASGLAFNAPWIFGGTAVALVIVLLRGARFRRKDKVATAAHRAK